MARTQSVMWTLLPNGVYIGSGGAKTLRASIYVSPRLTPSTEDPAAGALLGWWGDFVSETDAQNWATTVRDIKFGLEVASSQSLAKTQTISPSKVRVLTSPDAALWADLFSITTMVNRFQFNDIGSMSLSSFSQAAMLKSIRKLYKAIASKPEIVSASSLPLPETLLRPPGMKGSVLMAALPPEHRPQSLGVTVSAQAEQMWSDFRRFSQPFEYDENGASAQSINDENIDFHALLGSLGSYPTLLRRLGIVIDLEFPIASPVVAANCMRVVPVWPDGKHKPKTPDSVELTHEDVTPWTRYLCMPSDNRFEAAPRDPSRLTGGMLVMSTGGTDPSKDPTSVVNFDMQNAAVQVESTAIAAAAAVLRAEAQGLSLPRKGYVAQADADEEIGLPSLGQPSLGIAISGAKDKLNENTENAKAKNAAYERAEFAGIINFAEDMVRGYRVDVWDDVSGKWRSLCRRIGTYKIGERLIEWGPSKLTVADEGWIQTAMVSANGVMSPGAGKNEDLNVTESLFSWTGWSLVVPRSGKALMPNAEGELVREYTTTDANGKEVTYQLGDYQHKSMPLRVYFQVPKGSLPRLRFGYNYKFRARAVDLAGNSVSTSDLSATSGKLSALANDSSLASRKVQHSRFEPLRPPALFITEQLKVGESPSALLIRSNFDVTPAEKASRHVFPPRSSQSMIEAQGVLDQAAGSVDGSQATWQFLANLDSYSASMASLGEQNPLVTIPKQPPYMPDPQARGVAFIGLPGVEGGTAGTKRLGGVWDPYIQSFPVKAAFGTRRKLITSLKVPFEKPLGEWFDRAPFTITMAGVEATDPRLPKTGAPATPKWSKTKRNLTVQVPKAEIIEIGTSCYLDVTDLNTMGVLSWAKEGAKSATKEQLNYTGLVGQNWTITPQDKITLIHAVQQPLIAPTLSKDARIERSAGDTHATLIDWMDVHGKSTERIEVHASWKEWIDDTAQPAPRWGATAPKRAGMAFGLGVGAQDTIALNAGRKMTRKSEVPAVFTKSGQEYQRHFLGDTKHRLIDYKVTATSRFAMMFPAGSDVTRTGETKSLHVPSSARPAPPRVAYAVPAFEWTKSGDKSTRRGVIRVYLERPWFSSGQDERLAVVLYAQSGWTQARDFVSEWGADPLYSSHGKLAAEHLALAHFPVDAAHKHESLHVPEFKDVPVDAVSADVAYDNELGLWYADVPIDSGASYFPFVKLALARYQPYSIDGLELSSVVLMDCIQVTPERSATVTRADDSVTVSVTGPSYKGASMATGVKTAKIEVVLQERGSGDDLAWVPVGKTVELANKGAIGGAVTWSGTLGATRTAGVSQRILIQEFESWATDFDGVERTKRLVYADAIAIS